MQLLKRDVVATVVVAIGGVLYGLWAADSAPWDMSTRVTGVVILVLGFVASASAVVPGFEQLLRGNRAYLVVTVHHSLLARAGAPGATHRQAIPDIGYPPTKRREAA